MSKPTTHNTPEYSVSEISGALKRVVEDTFGHVRLRGEVSGYRGPHSSGHCYFGLKDEKAKIDAVIWRGAFGKLKIKPEEGMEVIATGRLTTYPGSSKYQIVIEHVEPAGVGALLAQLEERKKRLAAEGLFDESRKKPLPFMPQTIGIITSPTGAVIQDILHRIRDRFPCHVLVWPVKVQGDGAAEEIAAAVKGFNAMQIHSFLEGESHHVSDVVGGKNNNDDHAITPPDSLRSPAPPQGGGIGAYPKPDLLIVARGGGSLEDLWCFNDEAVARAVADSAIPIVSAVGHETDTTLIDFVSDRRAPTPTAAAEIAVPVRDEWLYATQQRGLQLQQLMQRLIQLKAQQLEGQARGLLHPARLLETATQRLDDWGERLKWVLPKRLEQAKLTLTQQVARLRPSNLLRQMAQYQEALQRSHCQLANVMQYQQQVRKERLVGQGRLLESLNYTAVLKRGFALARDASGAAITSAAAAQSQPIAQVQFHDDVVDVDGTDTVTRQASAKKPQRVKKAPTDKQADLF